MDFVHDGLYGGRKFRTFNVIDKDDREALSIEVGTSIPNARVIRVLERLIHLYGKPAAVRSDNEVRTEASFFSDGHLERDTL